MIVTLPLPSAFSTSLTGGLSKALRIFHLSIPQTAGRSRPTNPSVKITGKFLVMTPFYPVETPKTRLKLAFSLPFFWPLTSLRAALSVFLVYITV